MTLIAIDGNPNTICSDTLSAGSPDVFIEGAKVGLNGDSSGGSVSSSQTTVKANGKYILLKGDAVAYHGDNPHGPQKLATPPQSTVSIG